MSQPSTAKIAMAALAASSVGPCDCFCYLRVGCWDLQTGRLGLTSCTAFGSVSWLPFGFPRFSLVARVSVRRRACFQHVDLSCCKEALCQWHVVSLSRCSGNDSRIVSGDFLATNRKLAHLPTPRLEGLMFLWSRLAPFT